MDVVLPKIALTMTEATIVEWYKQEGETVRQHEPLFSMETDKTEVEVEAPGEGVLAEIRYGAGETVEAGRVVATIREVRDGEPMDAGAVAAGEGAIAPAAKRLAAQLGVDLGAIRGSGTAGRIIEADVMKAAALRATSSSLAGKGPESVDRPLEVSRARAAGMQLTELTTRVPTFFLFGTLDFGAVHESMRLADVSVTDLLVWAAAGALKDVPFANAYTREGRVYQYPRARVGVLIRRGDALIPLVFDDPSRLSVASFGAERREAVARLEAGKLTAAQTSGATLVISNLGRYGVELFTTVLFPDTAVTLAVGSLGADASRSESVRVALTCDHRIIDGVDAANFLNGLQARIQSADLTPREGESA